MVNTQDMDNKNTGGVELEHVETVVPQESKEEKRFTQEEVNGFIQSRLGQMKKQAAKESMAELAQREKELEMREMRLAVREELEKRGMPKELSEVVSGSSLEEIGGKLDRLNEIYGNKETKKAESAHGFMIGSGDKENTQMDAIREAFGLR